MNMKEEIHQEVREYHFKELNNTMKNFVRGK